MLLNFDPETGYLPPGTYLMAWADVSHYFGFNRHRSRLLVGFLVTLQNLSRAEYCSVLLNGSFVSNKELHNTLKASSKLTLRHSDDYQ